MPAPRRGAVVIAVPAHNAAGTIGETLRSLQAQTYPHLRIVVVDNASTDATPDLVTEQFPSVELQRHEVDVGAEGNFERCFALARPGELLAIYHSDDVYEPDAVHRQVQVLERHPDVGLVFSRAALIDAAGQPRGETPPFAELGLPAAADGLLRLDRAQLVDAVFRVGNFLVCPSAMARAEVWQTDVVRWDGTRFGTSADLDVWLRAARRWSVAVLERPVVRYRLSSTQGTAVYRRDRTTRDDLLRVCRAHLADPETHRLLGPPHEQWLHRAEYRDDLVIASNLAVRGDREAARRLLSGLPVDPRLSAKLAAWHLLFRTAVHVSPALGRRVGSVLAGR